MRTVFQTGMTILGGCVMMAVFWMVLAAPGFLSEENTLTHAAALTQMATR